MIFHSMEKRSCHVDEQVYRGANRVCHQTTRAGYAGRGDLSQIGHQRCYVLHVAAKVAGLGPSELKKLKQLEEENSKLKRLVADLSLDKAMLQDVLSKKL